VWYGSVALYNKERAAVVAAAAAAVGGPWINSVTHQRHILLLFY